MMILPYLMNVNYFLLGIQNLQLISLGIHRLNIHIFLS